MKEPIHYLNLDAVIAREVDGAWLVGFAFTTKEDGERAMRAIADLYNSVARVYGARNAP